MPLYSRILVPTDGSETARQGLREAIALGRELQSTLVLLHVVDNYPLLVEMASSTALEAAFQGLRDGGQELLQQAAQQVAQAGLPAETVLREVVSGRVADVISEEAKARQCQLIVMGTHGRRGLNRLAMGSDAELVLRCAAVPVLLVRSPRAEP